MIKKAGQLKFRKMIAGVDLGTMVYGEMTLMAQFKLKKGCDIPIHDHLHEQTGLLISGRIVIIVDGTEYDVSPGDSWCIGADVPHGARALEDSVAVEVFSPPRADYIQ